MQSQSLLEAYAEVIVRSGKMTTAAAGGDLMVMSAETRPTWYFGKMVEIQVVYRCALEPLLKVQAEGWLIKNLPHRPEAKGH